MQEMIDVFDMDWKFVWTKERNDFNKQLKEEYKKTWEIKYKVKGIWALLLNREEEFILVQRWNTIDSPWLIDKTISWHVSSWESFNETVLREMQEEIWVNWIVAKNEQDFQELLDIIDTTKKAVLLLIDDKDVLINVEWDIPYKRIFNAWVYMWIYDWNITSFPDNSSKSSLKIPANSVLSQIEQNKEKFTDNLLGMIKDYRDLILSIIKT
jgi:hypothetical protein